MEGDDTAALGRAVEALKVDDGSGKGGSGKTGQSEEAKKVVKVEAGDVAFLVSCLV